MTSRPGLSGAQQGAKQQKRVLQNNGSGMPVNNLRSTDNTTDLDWKRSNRIWETAEKHQ